MRKVIHQWKDFKGSRDKTPFGNIRRWGCYFLCLNRIAMLVKNKNITNDGLLWVYNTANLRGYLRYDRDDYDDGVFVKDDVAVINTALPWNMRVERCMIEEAEYIIIHWKYQLKKKWGNNFTLKDDWDTWPELLAKSKEKYVVKKIGYRKIK